MQTQTTNKFINCRKANKSHLFESAHFGCLLTCDLDFVWQPSFCLCVCVRLMREHQNKCLVEQTHCQLEQIFCQQFSYALVESARTENSKIATSPGTIFWSNSRSVHAKTTRDTLVEVPTLSYKVPMCGIQIDSSSLKVNQIWSLGSQWMKTISFFENVWSLLLLFFLFKWLYHRKLVKLARE